MRVLRVAAALAALTLAGGRAVAGDAAAPRVPGGFEAVDERHGRVIGAVRLDAAYRMTVERAPDSWRARLRDIAAEMNAKDVLTLPVPPPPGAARFTRQGMPVGRDDPRFLDALRSYLHRFHELALR